MAIWSLDQIQWDKFDPSLVDTRSLVLAKGAALVEANAADYVQYLTNVFRGDADLCNAIEQWGIEERQHGEALARWAKLADPNYDFDKSFKKFTSIYRIQVDAQTSYRGSRAQELVARCLVETGTSTYYSALADAAQEPVFKQICRYISADEIHHYKLFFRHLSKYEELDNLSRFSRIKTAVQRSVEVEDEELSLAFACGNYPERDIQKSEFREYAKEFLGLTYDLYQRPHIAKATKLMMNAAGIPSKPWVTSSMTSLINGVVSYRQRAMNKNRATL